MIGVPCSITVFSRREVEAQEIAEVKQCHTFGRNGKLEDCERSFLSFIAAGNSWWGDWSAEGFSEGGAACHSSSKWHEFSVMPSVM